MASGVLLQSLGNGALWDSAGNALNGHNIYVYQRGTSTQVPVYANSNLTGLLTQPLVTGSTGAGPGGIPGYVAGEQSLDFYDATTSIRTPAELVAGRDVVGDPSGNGTANWAVIKEAPLNVQWVEYGAKGDGSTDDTAAIQAAINAVPSNGGAVAFPPSANPYLFSSLTMKTGARLLALGGPGAVTLAFSSTTGHVFDLTGRSFCTIEGFSIRPNSSMKTAGEVFYLDTGAGSCQRNTFRDLQMSSPFRGWTLNNVTMTLIENVQFLDFNSGWGYDSGIALTGAATSTVIRALRGGTAAGITNALLYVPTGTTVDTLLCDDWDILGLSGSSMGGINLQSGEWMRFSNISVESGTAADAITIGGTAKGVTLTGVHCLGLRGVYVQGGKGIEIHGGEIVQCQREGVLLTALSTLQDVTIANLDVSDTGLATTNTYPAIHATGGFSYFRVLNCSAGNNRLLSSANRASYGIQVDASSDYYVLANNQCEGATGGVLDNGGGTHKIVSNI